MDRNGATPGMMPYGPSERGEAPTAALWSPSGQIWALVLLLMAFSILMVWSASVSTGMRQEGFLSGVPSYPVKQAIFAALGVALILFFERFPYRVFLPLCKVLLLGMVLALVLVLIPGFGVEINRARRWFAVGSFLVQPSEYAKVGWVIYLSGYLTRKKDRLDRLFSGLGPSLCALGLVCVLLLLEPDFGTCAILVGVSFVLWTAGGVPWRHLFLFVPLAGLALGALVIFSPYRLTRLMAFLNPWTDPLDSGYNLIQSLIAVGSGGLWGKGLGAGQQKLFYLPEPFTDFIVAVMAEELGFVGMLFLTAVVLFLFWRGLGVALNAVDDLGGLLALGLTFLIVFQAWFNIGVVLGLFPTKGLTCPFLSYGGSSLTANCIAVGIILSVARRARL
ncbi:putative lipid II flippase FtsW [Desulfosoma caldarium]|uniref:Probable peptidoglycan glycosyltransferase FtsW n=1 Tax=Desulfosoma caldarium TaxID=610254 RepID=A0A3N1UQ46_9BACT|nr:putative lipid II flippase FtsW [Desulfosoma caldarium]ROQ93252.1 cell division protein FtsW [Desulfosoma caldarium]